MLVRTAVNGRPFCNALLGRWHYTVAILGGFTKLVRGRTKSRPSWHSAVELRLTAPLVGLFSMYLIVTFECLTDKPISLAIFYFASFPTCDFEAYKLFYLFLLWRAGLTRDCIRAHRCHGRPVTQGELIETWVSPIICSVQDLKQIPVEVLNPHTATKPSLITSSHSPSPSP